MLHGVEGALLQTTVGELREPALDEIQPRRTGRREVQVPASALGVRQPLLHGLGLVRREVVEHNVNVETRLDVQINEAEEVEDVFGRVTRLGVVEDVAGRDVHRREQQARRRAVGEQRRAALRR